MMSQGFKRDSKWSSNSPAYLFLQLIQQLQVATKSTSPDMTTVFQTWQQIQVQIQVSWAYIAMLEITLSGRSLMYSRKSVGPKIDPWGTPALTGYSCEDYPSRITWICLLLEKEKIRPNNWPAFHGTYVCEEHEHGQTLLKALDISKLQLG